MAKYSAHKMTINSSTLCFGVNFQRVIKVKKSGIFPQMEKVSQLSALKDSAFSNGSVDPSPSVSPLG